MVLGVLLAVATWRGDVAQPEEGERGGLGHLRAVRKVRGYEVYRIGCCIYPAPEIDAHVNAAVMTALEKLPALPEMQPIHGAAQDRGRPNHPCDEHRRAPNASGTLQYPH